MSSSFSVMHTHSHSPSVLLSLSVSLTLSFSLSLPAVLDKRLPALLPPVVSFHNTSLSLICQSVKQRIKNSFTAWLQEKKKTSYWLIGGWKGKKSSPRTCEGDFKFLLHLLQFFVQLFLFVFSNVLHIGRSQFYFLRFTMGISWQIILPIQFPLVPLEVMTGGKKKTKNLFFIKTKNICLLWSSTLSQNLLFCFLGFDSFHVWYTAAMKIIIQYHALFEGTKKRKLVLCTVWRRKTWQLDCLCWLWCCCMRVLAISSSSRLESWLRLILLGAVRRDGHADYPLMRKSLSLASVHNKRGGWFVSLITLRISLTPKADPKAALFTLGTQVT